MSLQRIVFLAPLCALLLSNVSAQTPGTSFDPSAARAKLRPIGSPSLVDALRQAPRPRMPTAANRQFAIKPVIQQTAMMQATGGFVAPPLGAQPPFAQPPATMPTGPSTPLPGPPSTRPVAPTLSPNGMQPVLLDTRVLPSGPQPGSAAGDLAPMQQPGLQQNMATVDNCACVSAPSSYNAGGMWNCSPEYVVPCSVTVPASAPYMPPQAIVPQQVISPAVVPTAMVPTAGCKPLFTLGQDPYNVQLGQGIIGQPKAYVPGQSVRNFIRYFTP